MPKPVPHYWWDFEHENYRPVGIVVEGDLKGAFRIAFFHFGFGFGTADDAIKQAERLIRDLKAGRSDPRALAKELKEKEKHHA